MTTVREMNLTFSAKTGICDMASKWHGQPCPLCGLGTLHDGLKTAVQEYKGHSFSVKNHGAFCDHCADGMVEFDAAEEAAWLVFRDNVDASAAAELRSVSMILRHLDA